MLHQFFDRVCTCTPRHASRTSRATFNIQLFILCDGRMVCFYVLKKFFCFLFVFFSFLFCFSRVAIKMDGQWRAKFVPGNNSDQSRVFQGLQKFFSIKMHEANLYSDCGFLYMFFRPSKYVLRYVTYVKVNKYGSLMKLLVTMY